MNDFLIPYTNELCIEPVKKEQILVSDQGNLQTYGEVIAAGPEVENTKVGDYVAFEIWDDRAIDINDKRYHFIKEDKAITKIPTSWITKR